MGAAVLAAQAALRTGSGKLSVLTPRCGIRNFYKIQYTETMIEINNGVSLISGYYGLEYKVIAMGLGDWNFSRNQRLFTICVGFK